ncbi:hypothetical protein BG004_000791 [Podila humilis]|nr:hypothetical protein BG004_000791 [Podila humilis]
MKINNEAVTVVDKPFIFKAVENCVKVTDPGLQAELKTLMDRSDAAAKGNVFERFMMTVFIETFKARRLSDWPLSPDLDGDVEIDGWKDPGLLQGTTHAMLSMEVFMDAHVNHHSTRNNAPVAPFFFPATSLRTRYGVLHPHRRSKGGTCLRPAQPASFSASCIQAHAKDFRNFCHENIYISMVVAYPMTRSPYLPPVQVPNVDASGVQQVVIHVGDSHFGQIFPKEHVRFIDRLKNAGKRSAEDDDSDVEDRFKKQRS